MCQSSVKWFIWRKIRSVGTVERRGKIFEELRTVGLEKVVDVYRMGWRWRF